MQPAHETDEVERVVVAWSCDSSLRNGRETYDADIVRLFSRLHARVLMSSEGWRMDLDLDLDLDLRRRSRGWCGEMHGPLGIELVV